MPGFFVCRLSPRESEASDLSSVRSPETSKGKEVRAIWECAHLCLRFWWPRLCWPSVRRRARAGNKAWCKGKTVGWCHLYWSAGAMHRGKGRSTRTKTRDSRTGIVLTRLCAGTGTDAFRDVDVPEEQTTAPAGNRDGARPPKARKLRRGTYREGEGRSI